MMDEAARGRVITHDCGEEVVVGEGGNLIDRATREGHVCLPPPGASKDNGDASGGHPQHQTDAQALVAIGHERAELFHDGTGTAFAAIRAANHREIWSLTSRRFSVWLRREFYEERGKPPRGEAVSSAIGVLEGFALFKGVEHRLHNRVARHDGTIWYDLADAEWRAVRIDQDGWVVVDEPPILFRRYSHQSPQVLPAAGGDLDDFFRFVNVSPEDRLLLKVALVAAFEPDISHPMLVCHGEQGSGKSLGQSYLRRLIDPSRLERLTFPSDKGELIQQLAHHYAPIYDNIDRLTNEQSGLLCRAVTGEGFSKRKLYTDDDDQIYAYRRVLLLNGINVVAQRPDALDRSVLMRLERIARADRREERELDAEFEAVRPRLLGAIFDALSASMRHAVELPTYERMADFTRVGAAVAEALGDGAEAFLESYRRNNDGQIEEAVHAHLVGGVVVALMERQDEWEGSPTELLAMLEIVGCDSGLLRRGANGMVQDRAWPRTANALTRRLNEVRSNLRDLGIDVTDGRSGRTRWISLRRGDEDSANTVMTVTSVTSTAAPEAGVGAHAWEAVIE